MTSTVLKSSRPKPPRPKLPLSAFTSPPNTGTSDSFPVPRSPVAKYPKNVLDGHVIAYNGDLTRWKAEAGRDLQERLAAIILSIQGTDLPNVIDKLESFDTPIASLSVPFKLEDKVQTLPPSLPTRFHLSTVLGKSTPDGVASLKWALEQARPVDIDIQGGTSDIVLESVEDVIHKATDGLSNIPPIILSNVLPPPHDLELPIVKLMNHPTYLAFQSQAATLSLFPYVSVKFLPPSWGAPTPPTPSVEVSAIDDAQQKKEWKRRIKMYLGPVIEAFGYERIIFGSCPTMQGSPIAQDWYELARESLVELGVEQEVVDAVFEGNARRIYSIPVT